ncbi:unnamed protein product [Trichogramma brassicae]|uniref:Uncharacterized protein n=1 Tax=Trichogramma brassicae TaxID=86971 RepID=A0A6H5IZN7_9HYME|nr:unnamed protein product [Trichogramma brassicae]
MVGENSDQHGRASRGRGSLRQFETTRQAVGHFQDMVGRAVDGIPIAHESAAQQDSGCVDPMHSKCIGAGKCVRAAPRMGQSRERKPAATRGDAGQRPPERSAYSPSRVLLPVAYSCEMLVAAFISGSTRRYDAKFVAELFTEEEKYSKRYKPTTKFPKDFFAERKSIFEFIGNTAPEMLEFIFYALQKLRPIKSGTTITGWVPEDRPYRGSIIRDTGVQYDAEYRVHELMRRLAAYVHFKGTNEYPRLTEINPCEYFTRKRKVVKCIFWDEVC